MHVLQLLGFPIQLFGLLLLPSTIVKYLVEKDDPSEDVRSGLVRRCAFSVVVLNIDKLVTTSTLLQNNLTKRLPGLEKESF